MIRFSICRALIGLALASSLSACTDRDDVVTSSLAPEAPVNGRTMYLSVSTLTPAAGEEVVVSLNAVGAEKGLAVGSFKVKMTYDVNGLEFLGAVPQNDGMVIANPVSDTLIVVGASGDGFTSSALARIRMKVKSASALHSLGLEIVGLTTTDFASQAPTTAVDRRLFRGNVTLK